MLDFCSSVVLTCHLCQNIHTNSSQSDPVMGQMFDSHTGTEIIQGDHVQSKEYHKAIKTKLITYLLINIMSTGCHKV